MENIDYVTAGVFYALVDYITRLFNPMINIVNQFSQMERSLVAADRIFEVLNMEGEEVSKQRIPRYEGNVMFENVSFAYGTRKQVFENFLPVLRLLNGFELWIVSSALEQVFQHLLQIRNGYQHKRQECLPPYHVKGR